MLDTSGLTYIYRHNANTSVQCPVAPGLYEVQQTVSLPKEIPPGKTSI